MTTTLAVLAFTALVILATGTPLAHWSHRPWRATVTKPTCPCCPRTRANGQYLCGVCWRRLPPAARARLSTRDSRAFARLRELHRQIDAQVPLENVQVSP